MRILFLTKRFPQQRDLIERPYGRFAHLPVVLARLGNEVRIELLSHRGLDSESVTRSGVQWSSRDVVKTGPKVVWQYLVNATLAFRPDWIIGCSDAWFGWMAHRLSQRAGCRFAVDAYDNFEAYMPWNLPLHWAWRRALRAADLVIAAGPQLAARLEKSRKGGQPVRILPMAPDPAFHPLEREHARGVLGLPEAPLVGYFGSWTRNRGTGILRDCVERVRSKRADVRFVFSGRVPRHVGSIPGVISLGYLDDAQLPLAVNALDVACVITADNAFGRFSYPAKLCEAMACGVPVVATATAPVRWMLREDCRFLAAPGNAAEIAERILENLDRGRVDFGRLTSWQDGGRVLHELLGGASGATSR